MDVTAVIKLSLPGGAKPRLLSQAVLNVRVLVCWLALTERRCYAEGGRCLRDPCPRSTNPRADHY